MKPHELRVITEKRELDERLTKLIDFIDASNLFGTLPDEEQSRLRLQFSAMQAYSNILGQRIACFSTVPVEPVLKGLPMKTLLLATCLVLSALVCVPAAAQCSGGSCSLPVRLVVRSSVSIRAVSVRRVRQMWWRR